MTTEIDPTILHYDRTADAFFARTAGLDVSHIRRRFARFVVPGGRVLDAGCGIGRDAKAFLADGFKVDAFDASAELARMAERHAGIPVACMHFQNLDVIERYDGIWCAASLLHVPTADEIDVYRRLLRALKPGGVWYISYKEGAGLRQDGARRFTDHTLASLTRRLDEVDATVTLDSWVNGSVDAKSADRFINLIVRKTTATMLTA